MNDIRDRARGHLPAVLLTLLSIVQALALEFLWTYVRETPQIFSASWTNALVWVQLGTSFLGLVLIWVVYASQVMRLRWVPATMDSVYPFIIGLLEFAQIENLGAETIGQWLVCFACIFAIMVWVSHRTMRRARRDGQNSRIFDNLAPAEFKDFYAPIASVTGVTLIGVYVATTHNTGLVAMFGLLLTAGLVTVQFRVTTRFWDESVSEG